MTWGWGSQLLDIFEGKRHKKTHLCYYKRKDPSCP